MTFLRVVLAAALVSTALPGSLAFAQNAPGVPGGILGDSFQLNEHPQMPFAASAPDVKYQHGRSAARKRADNGDPSGCNLQCPSDAQ
ncbi:hypothetical protein OVY01_13460 [Robbsia sp. Bb-Pol-6]|uniref:Uncharacterized protein n=1 Tax=Robbsia betulipollinis TaxID=2981849 RepID=A0ABT3ZNU8_9BURK|nr:hypothetical protein [Robbsia betulipollinis]MCY0388226.1 hypothetical protein [Robbsia betulipollinis]